jgi:hypothetical protein
MVDRIGSIATPDMPPVEVKDFSMLDEAVRRQAARERAAAEAEGDDFRAVAPAVMSFGAGRRR